MDYLIINLLSDTIIVNQSGALGSLFLTGLTKLKHIKVPQKELQLLKAAN